VILPWVGAAGRTVLALVGFATRRLRSNPIHALTTLLGLSLTVGVITAVPLYAEGMSTRLLREHLRLARSDAVSWLLYYFNRFAVRVPDSVASDIVCSRDCIPILMLYLSGDITHQSKVMSFARKIDKDDLYELDKNWLLLYQLFVENRLPNPYGDDRTFEILKNGDVSFVHAGN